ncbi:MAG: TonB-dependent receptor [Bacteroides sp.]|nr:TonB-dependent receptor [Bacteroides sp.]MCM1095103.1 TonB-dependent receptor [Terasakiella sp.]
MRLCLMRLLPFVATVAAAQAPDTVALRDVEVTAPHAVARRGADGAVRFDTRSTASVPRTLGEADPLRYLRTLPGISAVSDISSGVTIDGSDGAQNIYRLNGIPVHFPYHFGGVFGVFNPVMYPRVTLRKSMRAASSPDYLGGTVDVGSAAVRPERPTGRVTAGMLASTLTAMVPAGRVVAGVGARVSYLDLLYGGLLRRNSGEILYNFSDVDLSVDWRPGDRDAVVATFHINGDRLTYGDDDFAMSTRLRWRVLVAGIEWRATRSALSMTHRAYRSQYSSRLGIIMPQMGLTARASIGESGVEGRFDIPLPRDLRLDAGYSLRVWDYVPQWVDTYGIGLSPALPAEARVAVSAGADAALSRRAGRATLSAGARLTHYRGHGGFHATVADPQVTVSVDASPWQLSAQVASASQFVHQVGLSEIGLASNFRLAADSVAPPQRRWGLSMAASRSLGGIGELSVEWYGKLVRRQTEYTGAILDMVLDGYSPEDYIWTCRGYNTGVNMMASYTRPGPVSGSLSYSWCLARRRRNDAPGWFTASSEIAHSLKADACWRIGRGWEASTAFCLTSGRPYTPVTAVYLIGERVMMEYGRRNSARMPAYVRLDVGGAYRFTTGAGRLSHRIDLSVLNVLNRPNVEMYAYTVNMDKLIIRRREIRTLFRLLPSLSYEISF